MTSNETEAVKLAQEALLIVEVRRNDGSRNEWYDEYISKLARALLATPQAEPQDEERARRWLIEYWSNDPDVVVHPDDIAELSAQFAAIRAERAAIKCKYCGEACKPDDQVVHITRCSPSPPQEGK